MSNTIDHFQEAAKLLAKEFPGLELPESGAVTLTDEQAKRLREIERRLQAADRRSRSWKL